MEDITARQYLRRFLVVLFLAAGWLERCTSKREEKGRRRREAGRLRKLRDDKRRWWSGGRKVVATCSFSRWVKRVCGQKRASQRKGNGR
ncbi:uncharacterized protein J3D65DRAFT_623550 [Phyllosticta citribraziliensis]|uniref:Secreted protein n=1 Tax=Phyllosticta citribraziliensis TaxID=989973 RepID=A0ABR1LSU3_9PEZI